MLYFAIPPYRGESGSVTFKTTIVIGRGNVTKEGVLSQRMTATYFYRQVSIFERLMNVMDMSQIHCDTYVLCIVTNRYKYYFFCGHCDLHIDFSVYIVTYR